MGIDATRAALSMIESWWGPPEAGPRGASFAGWVVGERRSCITGSLIPALCITAGVVMLMMDSEVSEELT